MTATDDVITALWPGAEIGEWRLRQRRGAHGRMIVTAGIDDVRNVFPWRPATIVAGSRRTSDDRSRTSQWRNPLGVAALLTVGAMQQRRRLACSGGTSLVAVVADGLGHPGARGIVMCGPPRANRKPVVQLHDRAGRTVAFVKVAFNDLTKRLLDAEAAALDHLASAPERGFSVPPVLGRGELGTAQWLAIGPIGVRRRHRPDQAASDALAIAIQRTAPTWRGSVAQSSFVRRLMEQSQGLADAEPIVAALRERDADVELVTAAGHGDYVPWNTLSGDPEPAVWDWERYETDVPIGFDRLHRRVQIGIRRSAASIREVVLGFDSRLDEILPDVDRGARHAHVDWYLAQMLCRYERDVADVSTPRLHDLISDLTSVLKERHR